MKYILLVPDGMADEPLPELDGKTPLQAARTPNMDSLASKGVVGAVRVTPPDMYPGSDAANMALLGYDPREHYTGRGPVEAAALEIPMDPRDVAFRCSLVTTDGERLLDYSGGHISTEDARPLIELAIPLAALPCLHVSYRHILLWNDGPVEVRTHPPHESMNEPLEQIMPVGDQDTKLRRFIWDSLELLDNHPYNKKRRDEGKPTANTLWPWGQGRAPKLQSFLRRHGTTGAVIAGVDVIRGLGRLTGLEVINVPGATGYFDTDYQAKARAAVEAVSRHDFVWIHVEAPDEAGHAGDIDEKIRAIENIDNLIVGPLIEAMKKLDDIRILIVPDHATPVHTRGHKIGPVPFLLFDSRDLRANNVPFDERALDERVTMVDDGFRLIDQLFGV